MFLQSIEALVRVSEGDLRKAITFLQSAARLNVDKEITEGAVIEIAGVRHTCLCHITVLKMSCTLKTLLRQSCHAVVVLSYTVGYPSKED